MYIHFLVLQLSGVRISKGNTCAMGKVLFNVWKKKKLYCNLLYSFNAVFLNSKYCQPNVRSTTLKLIIACMA